MPVSRAHNSRELIERFERRIEGFNRRSLSFEDLEAACQKHDIEVVLKDMRAAHGAALWVDQHPYIYINKLLDTPLKIFNLGHEFTHITDQVIDSEIFLSTGKLWHKSKLERQANIIGAICLMPDGDVRDMEIEEMMSVFGVSRELAEFRRSLL